MIAVEFAQQTLLRRDCQQSGVSFASMCRISCETWRYNARTSSTVCEKKDLFNYMDMDMYMYI